MSSRDEMKDLLIGAFKAGVAAAHPSKLFDDDDLRGPLKEMASTIAGKVVIVGAGKASAAMAAAFEREWEAAGGLISAGLVVTREGYECATRWTEVVCAGHPYPDERSTLAVQRLLQLVDDLGEADLLVGLWSGGGSSLLSAPIEGVAINSLQDLGRALVNKGADIFEINTVRRHLLAASGGRLACAAAPAPILNIVLPDVIDPEDDDLWLATIASGPTVPDPTSLGDARQILETWEIIPTADIAAALQIDSNETPKCWDDIGTHSQITMILPGDAAIEGAATYLEDHWDGDIHLITPDPVGEAQAIGSEFGKGFSQPDLDPGIYLCAGELTVEVAGNGSGGPNQEFALALAIALDGRQGVYALSGDTDGIDGVGEAAGAFIAPDTLDRLERAGVDPQIALDRNDAGGAFAAIGDAIITGPTFTNVNDLRLVVING